MNASEIEQKLIQEWVFRSKSLNILIFGKIGTGKSSLINTLLNEQVAEEGAGLYSVTKKVEAYTRTIRPIKKIINDVRVTLWDTPGLRDPFTDEEKTLEDIREVYGDIDLFLFCTRMDQTRLGQDEFDAIRDLTEALGERIWKRAIFALTFANKTQPPLRETPTADQTSEYINSRGEEWKAGLQDVVNTFTTNIGGTIPVVPTGYKKELLPGGREWFTPFWEECLNRVRYDSIPALLRVNKDGWLHQEERRKIAARLVSHRLKELGDKIEAELTSQGIDVNVNNEQTFDVLAHAIQLNETSIISHFSRILGCIWEPLSDRRSVALITAVAYIAIIITKLR